jgi:uncharacterized alpha-E superfamily protein
MLSRIADALYWMSRYLERADNTARLVEINLLHLLEAEDVLSEAGQWRPLLGISGSEAAYTQWAGGAEIAAQKVAQFVTQERVNPNAIRSSLRLARENARVVRDRISREMWEAMNELWLQVDGQLRGPLVLERAAGFYRHVRNQVARFHGLTVSTMTRGEAFAFYQLGTFVERADMTARILDVKYHLLLPDVSLVGSALDYYQWAALLKSLSGFEAYRRKHHSDFRPADVADFMILEREFPRSLRFSVDRIAQALETVGGARERQPMQAKQELCAHLERRSAAEIFAEGMHEFLGGFLGHVAELHAALAAEYFDTYTGGRRCAT